jgi:GntR family transcriptional regulator
LIFIDPRGGKPIFEQIKDGLRGQILRGIRDPHDKLPSVRELAQSAAINPNTIQKAYRDLENEGFVYTVAGRGCYVAETPPGVVEKRRSELTGKVRLQLKELRVLGMGYADTVGLVNEIFERSDPS